jgi:glycosyltransferase involved in cell wall biosynthesis
MSVPGPQAIGDGIPKRIVSVCVATCDRPIGLANLLGALEALEIPAGATLQVVVVDNDSGESARAICDEVAARHAYSLHYVVEKRRGIPFARNAALAAALSSSDFVAFIDDDETPETDWLVELLRVQEYYSADVVTGPCLPRYVESPPRWVAEGGFHERPRYPTGTLRQVAFTHNALVRAAVFDGLDCYFDESMALNGGDDSEFFMRVYAAGFQIVWADNAIVRESVPASRSTVRWLVQRGFRVGTSSSWIELKHRSSSVFRLMAHGIYCMIKGTALAFSLPLKGRAVAVEGLRLFSYGLGRIAGSSGHLHQEYRVVHGA